VDLIAAALLGALQGLTEFLPVSSTAHLRIGEQILGFKDPTKTFTVIIQFGSILALMWLYRAKLLDVVLGLPSKPESRRFVVMLLVAFLPALVAGVFLNDFVKGVLYDSPLVIAVAFIAGGIVMLVVERYRPAPVVFRADRTPLGRALAVGACQALALIPGVSRSGATIIGGLLLRVERSAAAELSFFLAMPTLAAACLHDAWEVRHELSTAQAAEIGVGLVMAFVAAALVVRPFLRYVSRSGFAPFAWYRIAAGAAILGAIAAGWL
jgi:undecaprenyl-diphosphatase